MKQKSPVTLLIVDDQRLVREGIASLLDLQEEVVVLGTAENGREALIKARELKPEVILMDIRMPVMDGIAAAKTLAREGSPSRILMLTTFDDEEYIIQSLKAGAVGYLMKDLPSEELARAVVQARNGTFQLAPEVMAKLVDRLDTEKLPDTSPGAPSPEQIKLMESLSSREQEVLHRIARGETNREIADQVYLSEGTVKNYVSNILTTLDLRDRTQAALLAVKAGWDQSEHSEEE